MGKWATYSRRGRAPSAPVSQIPPEVLLVEFAPSVSAESSCNETRHALASCHQLPDNWTITAASFRLRRAGAGSQDIFAGLWTGTDTDPVTNITLSPNRDLGGMSTVQTWQRFELPSTPVASGSFLWLALMAPFSTAVFRPILQNSSASHAPSKRIMAADVSLPWYLLSSTYTLWYRLYGYVTP
jgi:hypothetical protein